MGVGFRKRGDLSFLRLGETGEGNNPLRLKWGAPGSCFFKIERMLSNLKPIPFSSEAVSSAGPASVPSVPGFKELFVENPLPMWIFETNSLRFLAVNDAAVARYGWSVEEFLAMTADQVRPESDLPSFLEYRRKVEFGMESGLKTGRNWRHVTKAGEVVAVDTAWHRIEYAGKKAIMVTIIDCSEARRTEEEVRELVNVLDLATDAIVVCDLERTILFWNHGATKTYGWTADEALDKKVHEIFQLDTDTILKCMSGLLGKGEWNGQMKHRCKDGTPAQINSRWTLVRDEETSEPKSILLINTDVTETKKLESQFLRAQRLDSLGTLASGIAHDLNNILSPILMATGMLRNSLNAEDRKMLQIIESSAERGAGIVKQVLTFARGADGERVLLNPKHLVSEMAKVMMQTFPKNFDIQTSIPADLWTLLGDATQLHQVLLNLCVNARDAMGEKGGALRVACENVEVDEHVAATNPGAHLGPHVCLSVTDTGSGMTTEVMEKIFDPFFTTKEQGKGTGLGLATTIGIVKGHKGFITIQSQVGQGTTFKVFIPANREGKSEEKKQEDVSALRGHGELVLVVDDEAPVREAIVSTLEAHGYRCYTAEDGTDALALFFERHAQIAVVVTDLHMGIMDGITLVRSMRKLAADTRIIVSSGHIHKENQATLNGLGVTSFLEKPYSAERLLRSIKAILTGPVPA
jgi:two-component system, cell cycle sensor histidine kinase and response regulator CckA